MKKFIQDYLLYFQVISFLLSLILSYFLYIQNIKKVIISSVLFVLLFIISMFGTIIKSRKFVIISFDNLELYSGPSKDFPFKYNVSDAKNKLFLVTKKQSDWLYGYIYDQQDNYLNISGWCLESNVSG